MTELIKDSHGNPAYWNASGSIAEVIVPILRDLRNNLHGWPGDPMTFEEWETILDIMIDGFELYAQDKYNDISYTPEFSRRVDLSLLLLSTYWYTLWD